jgi:hypothetical protein
VNEYALLLLLAGFTGSFVVSMLVDSMLGLVPAEFGPVYRFAEQVKISRFRTLLIKWAFMVVLALLKPGSFALRVVAAKPQRPNVIGLRLNRHATVMQVSCDNPVLNVVLFLPIFAPKGQPCRLSPPASGASQPAASG